MDRSLDEIISEARPTGRSGGRGGQRERRPPPRAPRREEYPRDGVRKYRHEERSNIDADWVHDRFEDDRYDRSQRRAPPDEDRYDPPRTQAQHGTRVRVENLHYELTEDDLRELFERIGPVSSVRLLYDRADRSQGTAFVIYDDYQDARQAVSEFDGCNANGQPIYLSLAPAGAQASKGSLIDRVEPRPRSLFERIENGADRRRRERSDSPRRSNQRLAPPDVDRYVPGRGSRSPVRRRGGGAREGGRRPGAKRETTDVATKGTANGGRRARIDEEGRPLVGGRPRKTAEELDAEMADYWANKNDDGNASATGGANGAAVASTTGPDVEMDIIE